MNPLIQKLKTYGNIFPETEREIHKKTQYIKKKKDDHLLKSGQSASSLFLLEKGIIRAYFIKNEKEINTWFGMENILIGSILPLYANKPSFENIS